MYAYCVGVCGVDKGGVGQELCKFWTLKYPNSLLLDFDGKSEGGEVRILVWGFLYLNTMSVRADRD